MYLGSRKITERVAAGVPTCRLLIFRFQIKVAERSRVPVHSIPRLLIRFLPNNILTQNVERTLLSALLLNLFHPQRKSDLLRLVRAINQNHDSTFTTLIPNSGGYRCGSKSQ
jgi:hypothetical protein